MRRMIGPTSAASLLPAMVFLVLAMSGAGVDGAGVDGASGDSEAMVLVEIKGAKCLDGSPAGYYFREAKVDSGKDNFVIVLGNSEWCTTEQQCADMIGAHRPLKMHRPLQEVIPNCPAMRCVPVFSRAYQRVVRD
jgi:hypothetical protein